MSRRRLTLAVGVLIVLAATLPVSRPAAALSSQRIPDQYIVVFKDRVAAPAAKARGLANQHGLQLGHIFSHALKGFAAIVPRGRLAALQSDPDVAFVEQDEVVTAADQPVPTGINRVDADLSPAARIEGTDQPVNVDVAVLDSGIDTAHPDLNVVGGKNCTPTPTYGDSYGHGTHVAGTIGAKDNDIGVVGVAPGARLWAVKVLNDQGKGLTSTVICGVDWMMSQKDPDGTPLIEVANLSLVIPGSEPDYVAGTTWAQNCPYGYGLHDAICKSVKASVVFVAAAGNDGVDFESSLANGDVIPAAYDFVIAATAMADFDGRPGGLFRGASCRADVDDSSASFSNWTDTGKSREVAHTLAAPGNCVVSTAPGGGYRTMSGTSMAAPHIAGAAALCIAAGTCAGGSTAVMSKLREDAAAQPASYGFTDDPHKPNGTRYYGYLVYSGTSSLVSSTAIAVAEGGTSAAYQVKLAGEPASDVIVTVATDGQTTASPAALTFTAATWNTPQTITIMAADDAIAEGAHTSTITHSAVSEDRFYNSIAVANVTVSIADNDTASVDVAPTTVNVVEGGAAATYSVVLTSQPASDVSITIVTDPQISLDKTSLVFTSASWNMPQSVAVAAVDDAVVEGNHEAVIIHSATSADPVYNGILVPGVTANVADSDRFEARLFLPLVVGAGEQ